MKLPPAPVIAALALAAAAAAAVALAACSGSSPPPIPVEQTLPVQPMPPRALPYRGPREVQAGAPIGDPTTAPPVHEARLVYVGPRDRPAVALTFDTGVGPAHMQEVLDILKERGVPATFGITGEWAVTNPELLKRIVAEGHAILNHSWSHASFTGEDTGTPPLSDEQVRDELRRTEEKIKEIADVSTKPYFRPPYGDYDSRVNRIAYEEGYEYDVLWYVDGMGWEGRPTKYVVSVTLKNAFNGSIFLYHIDNPFEYKALDDIIKGLGERGFQLVTIPQMLGAQDIPSPTPTFTPTAVPLPSSVVSLPPPPPPTRPAGPPLPAPTSPQVTPPPATPDPRIAWDDFEFGAAGGAGWLGPWQLNGAWLTAEDGPHAGGWHLRVFSPLIISRWADLSGRENVHLRFWSKLNSPAQAHVLVSSDGLEWQYALTNVSEGGDGVYRLYDIDLSGVVTSANFGIGFYGPTNVLYRWYIDDVELVTAEAP